MTSTYDGIPNGGKSKNAPINKGESVTVVIKPRQYGPLFFIKPHAAGILMIEPVYKEKGENCGHLSPAQLYKGLLPLYRAGLRDRVSRLYYHIKYVAVGSGLPNLVNRLAFSDCIRSTLAFPYKKSHRGCLMEICFEMN